MKNAERIVVVGYSFNNADEHFNDILRQQMHGKTITIIGPGVLDEQFLGRMEKVFHIPKGNWVSKTIQKHQAKVANHLQLVKCYADEVDVAEFFSSQNS